ncbi:MAG: ferritin [Bacteroidetes bacterium]|nr:MAG: ferritin [Bacteroidota bacterium]
MKTLLRMKTSLQESVQNMLNEQMTMEAHSSAVYLGMSSWCHEQGLIKTGEYFKKQSAEEREHMLRIFDYMIDMGGRAISPTVSDVQNDFTDLKSLLELYLEMEIKITESFNKMTGACIKVNDFQTVKFFEWFLNEQIEEEDNARRTLEIYELIGTELDGLFKIDHQIGELAGA